MKKRWWFRNRKIVMNLGPPKNSVRNSSCDTEAGKYERIFKVNSRRLPVLTDYHSIPLCVDILERLAIVHRMKNRLRVLCPVARSDTKMWTASNTIRKMVTKRKAGKLTIEPYCFWACEFKCCALNFPRINGSDTISISVIMHLEKNQTSKSLQHWQCFWFFFLFVNCIRIWKFKNKKPKFRNKNPKTTKNPKHKIFQKNQKHPDQIECAKDSNVFAAKAIKRHKDWKIIQRLPTTMHRLKRWITTLRRQPYYRPPPHHPHRHHCLRCRSRDRWAHPAYRAAAVATVCLRIKTKWQRALRTKRNA